MEKREQKGINSFTLKLFHQETLLGSGHILGKEGAGWGGTILFGGEQGSFFLSRARICKSLWSPRIDSEESISPAYVAWRASTTNRISYRPARLRIDTWSP